jgi:hypothetical protein
VEVELLRRRIARHPGDTAVQYKGVIAPVQVMGGGNQGGVLQHVALGVNPHGVHAIESIGIAARVAPFFSQHNVLVGANPHQLGPLGVQIGNGRILGQPPQAVGVLRPG